MDKKKSNTSYPDFVKSTGYGTGGGLCGWNCRHNFTPFDPEFMTNNLMQYNMAENEKAYINSQTQRRMERAIRKTKQKISVLKTALSNSPSEDLKKSLTIKLKYNQRLKRKQTDKYNSFCKENGLKPLPERLKIAEVTK